MVDIFTIKKFREATGIGMVEAKQVLDEAGGDMAKATDILRSRGMKAASKKADRTTGEGFVGSYIHSNGKVSAMVEVLCETDFVARTDDFHALAKDLAMHIAAANPLYKSVEDVPAEVVEKERQIYKEQIAEEGKPEAIKEKIIEGKLNKFYDDACLLRQKFIKDEDITIEQLLQNAIQKIGEKIQVGKFVRFHI